MVHSWPNYFYDSNFTVVTASHESGKDYAIVVLNQVPLSDDYLKFVKDLFDSSLFKDEYNGGIERNLKNGGYND